MITGDATPLFLLYGIGSVLGIGIVVWFVYQYGRYVKMYADKEEAYVKTEMISLDEYLKRMKPLIWEHAKLMDVQRNRTFRARLEKELVSDFFKEREETKKSFSSEIVLPTKKR